jgi:hypothetical protein
VPAIDGGDAERGERREAQRHDRGESERVRGRPSKPGTARRKGIQIVVVTGVPSREYRDRTT